MNSASAEEIIIFGVGASRADVLDIITAINAAAGRTLYSCRGYLDDNEKLWGTTHMGIPVLGGIERAGDYPKAHFVNAIGSAERFRLRMSILRRAGVKPGRYVTLVHPQATVSPSARLGRGCIVMPGARVSANAHLHDGVFLMHNAFVGHDTEVGCQTYLAPGAMSAGFNSIGPCCYLGMQSSLRENITIGEGSLIGMGAVVLKNVEANSVVIGNPAKVLRQFSDTIQPATATWPTDFEK